MFLVSPNSHHKTYQVHAKIDPKKIIKKVQINESNTDPSARRITDELGRPSMTLGVNIVSVVVDSRPNSDTVNVITDGGGEIVGSAETFPRAVFSPKMGL